MGKFLDQLVEEHRRYEAARWASLPWYEKLGERWDQFDKALFENRWVWRVYCLLMLLAAFAASMFLVAMTVAWAFGWDIR